MHWHSKDMSGNGKEFGAKQGNGVAEYGNGYDVQRRGLA